MKQKKIKLCLKDCMFRNFHFLVEATTLWETEKKLNSDVNTLKENVTCTNVKIWAKINHRNFPKNDLLRKFLIKTASWKVNTVQPGINFTFIRLTGTSNLAAWISYIQQLIFIWQEMYSCSCHERLAVCTERI